MAGNHRKMDRRIKVNGDRSSCDVTWAGLEVREESSIGAIHSTGWRPMTPRSSGGSASASFNQVLKEQDPTPRRRYTTAVYFEVFTFDAYMYNVEVLRIL